MPGSVATFATWSTARSATALPMRSSEANTIPGTRIPSTVPTGIRHTNGSTRSGSIAAPESRRPGSGAGQSGVGSVAQVEGAAPEPAFAQQVQLYPDVVGEGPRATTHQDGHQEQVPLVDQPGPDRLPGEVGTPHREVPSRSRLHLPDRLGVEVPLDPRPGAGDRLQRPGVHDLVGPAPDLREVPHEGWLAGDRPVALPEHHHLVLPSPVQLRPDRPLEVD